MLSQFHGAEPVEQHDLRYHVATEPGRRAPEVHASFEKIMSGGYDNANGGLYTPLELLVMELFRTISPNGGSLSALEDTRQSQNGDNYGDSRSPYVGFGLPCERHGFMITPRTSTSFDPQHWKNPQQFDPERYRSAPTSAQIDEDKCRQIGFPRCPFDITTFPVSDGRKAGLPTAGSGRYSAWPTASRCRSATMPGLRRSASTTGAVPASS